MCLDKVSYLCTMILNYLYYGTRQETINLYHQDGCQDCSLSAKQEGKCLANHRCIYIGKYLKKNKEKYDEAILLQIRRA